MESAGGRRGGACACAADRFAVVRRVALAVSLAGVLLVAHSASPTETPYAYISSLSTNRLFVVDVGARVLVASVPVGLSPRGVAVHPRGTCVYVANDRSGTLSVIDTARNAVLASVPVGAGPDGVAVHPAGRFVYVTNRDSATVSVIDAETNESISTVAVGERPRGIAVSASGDRVYVANSTGHSVSVIDAWRHRTVATIPVGPPMHPARTLHGVAVHPDGNPVYVAAAGAYATGALLVIDATTRQVVTVGLPAPARGVAVDPDGSAVYVTSVAEVSFPGPAVVPSGVSFVSSATNRVRTFVPLSASSWGVPTGIAVHRAGRLLYVTNEDNYSLYLVSLATSAVIRTVPLPSPSSGYGPFIDPRVPTPRSQPPDGLEGRPGSGARPSDGPC